MNVSAQEYFDLLQKYLLRDLKKTVSFQTKKSDLRKGYKFDKEYKTAKGETFVSHQEIVAMESPTLYELNYTIPGGKQTISHRISEIDDEHIKVEYEESIDSSDMGIKFRQLRSRGKSKKAMKDVLDRLELEIITSR